MSCRWARRKSRQSLHHFGLSPKPDQMVAYQPVSLNARVFIGSTKYRKGSQI
jgi:hypothetical protein